MTNNRDVVWLHLERVERIELSRSAWEADRLPLHHTRRVPRSRCGSALPVIFSPVAACRLWGNLASGKLLTDLSFCVGELGW